MNYEIVMEMQRICAGEERELTRGQIAEETIDIKKEIKNLPPDKARECEIFYEKMLQDASKKAYNVDTLMTEKEAIQQEFDTFRRESIGNDSFHAMYDAISEFFMNPPFEGLDTIEYGVNEVCVFAVLEYVAGRRNDDHDHEGCRKDYWDSIAQRTYDATADHWIGVYDDLQKRFDKIWADADAQDPAKAPADGSAAKTAPAADRALQEKMAACGILAIAAIRDQDAFSLDRVQGGALQKAQEVVGEFMSDNYEEGRSDFTDNVVRLLRFLNEFFTV